MQIISPAFAAQQNIPSQYTCKGDNSNPPLKFSEIPTDTKSLVLIVDDPDVASGTWVHWVVYNMNPAETTIAENSKPSGTEGMTSFGKSEYGGPCPPSGTHHYHFKLYALDTTLDFSTPPDKQAVEEKMQGHILAQAELVGLFSN